MTTPKFHEGQEVEVCVAPSFSSSPTDWFKAKIVREGLPGWFVQFPGGTLGVFDAEHIRALTSCEDCDSALIAHCADPEHCGYDS